MFNTNEIKNHKWLKDFKMSSKSKEFIKKI